MYVWYIVKESQQMCVLKKTVYVYLEDSYICMYTTQQVLAHYKVIVNM